MFIRGRRKARRRLGDLWKVYKDPESLCNYVGGREASAIACVISKAIFHIKHENFPVPKILYSFGYRRKVYISIENVGIM